MSYFYSKFWLILIHVSTVSLMTVSLFIQIGGAGVLRHQETNDANDCRNHLCLLE